MRFKDMLTGTMLNVTSDEVIEQYKKHSERYKEVKPEPKKEKK